jgi:hypothetical protein
MKYRKLRIMFSAVCGIACLLLLVLWIASYNWLVEVRGMLSSQVVELSSVDGEVRFHTWKEMRRGIPPTGIFTSRSSDRSFYWSLRTLSPLGIYASGRNLEAWAAHWLLAIFALALAAAPRIRWSRRFSLRALLIATMLIGLLLGFIVAASR